MTTTKRPSVVWADIENPPQAQYLLPVVRAARTRGAAVFVTARDYGDTFELLDAQGEAYRPVGTGSGQSKFAKGLGVLRRARALASALRASETPTVAVCVSRAAVIAARRLGIPCFVTTDYEYSDMSVYRLGRARLLFPDVINRAVFQARGIDEDRLMPYRGLKEDLTFAGVSVDDVAPARLEPEPGEELVRVLFRPPAEESHYYKGASRSLALEALQHLSRRSDIVVVFSPRHPSQVSYLRGLVWDHEPIVLRSPLPALALLKAVDLVITSGGTMLREAAYLGIPAYSIFQSEIGGVDRYLESVGRAVLLGGSDQLPRIQLVKRGPLELLRTNPGLVEEIATILCAART
jgi:predicted glycosyltransferase